MNPTPIGFASMSSQAARQRFWDAFCAAYVPDVHTPLFSTDDQCRVESRCRGKTRTLLCRNLAMEALMRCEVGKVVADHASGADMLDGIIYMMYWRDQGRITPLYIGKSEKYGKSDRVLSANLKRIESDTSKFGRWGDGRAYHIGDLSAVVLSTQSAGQQGIEKYRDWAARLFSDYPSDKPRLKQPVYLWVKAWNPKDVGPWVEFGPTSLTFLEYQLIGVASSLFPDHLLNVEGRNR
jgi:hypothetical protein